MNPRSANDRKPPTPVSMPKETVPSPRVDPARQASAAAKSRAEATVIGLTVWSGLLTGIARWFALVGVWSPPSEQVSLLRTSWGARRRVLRVKFLSGTS